ncbi:MAG: hypothetical protein HLUCCO16_20190 [Phormidium sp. OSCR]|nr:MAG: hypothetical protein HLUCCO16_20190 [Phormidium sp. OSCR]
MANSGWSNAVQLDQSSNLWFKFKHDSTNGNWDILCSGDKDSLDGDNIEYHDHYFLRNGTWYFQGNHKGEHTIGRDQFLDVSTSRQDADSRSMAAYGNAGYDPNERIHAIEVSHFCDPKRIDGYVEQFKSQSSSQSSANNEVISTASPQPLVVLVTNLIHSPNLQTHLNLL